MSFTAWSTSPNGSAGRGNTGPNQPTPPRQQQQREKLSAARTASLLRRSSRLIHTLQKERGASCALCAACSTFPSIAEGEDESAGFSGEGTGEEYLVGVRDHSDHSSGGDVGGVGGPDGRDVARIDYQRNSIIEPLVVPSQLLQGVRQSRRDVDVALKSFLASVGRVGNSSTSTLPLGKSLANIRKAVNAAADITDEEEGEGEVRGEGGKINHQSELGASLRKVNLTPPIEVADEANADMRRTESGIGAALRRAESSGQQQDPSKGISSSMPRRGSLEFGGDRDEKGKTRGGFHPILLMFNGLVSTLIRVYVVEICHREMNLLAPKAGEQGSSMIRTNSIASLGMKGSGGGITPSFLPPSSPRAPVRPRTLTDGSPSWHRPQGMPPPPPAPPSLAHGQQSPSLRDLRSAIMQGGVPMSDPSLFAPGQPQRGGRASQIEKQIREGARAAAMMPAAPSLMAKPSYAIKQDTRWGSYGGFDLPPPTMHVGSYDATTAPRQVTTMPRHDSRTSIATTDSGSGRGQQMFSAFVSPSTQSPLASKSISLLSLLLSFTKLKESTGIERAVLSSLMALPSVPTAIDTDSGGDDAIRPAGVDTGKLVPTMLFSDLVLEEENQRRVVRKLRSVSRAGRLADAASALEGGISYGGGDVNFQSLLMLVEESVRLTPDMERIQDTIRRDFNLAAFHKEMAMGNFWGLITVYMDRLHATELLIIEELECCLGDPKASEECEDHSLDVNNHESASRLGLGLEPSNVASVLRDILGAGDGANKERGADSVAQKLQRTSPAELKEKLLAALSAPSTSISSGSEGDSVRFGQSGTDTNSSFVQQPPDSFSPEDYTPSDWDIDPYEIEFRKRIGRGVAGTTYLATWSGQPVAVKIAAITDLGIGGWKTECESLRRLHHPNVVRMLGSIFNPNPRTFGLVLEYCEAGDLKNALNRWTPKNFFWKIAGDIANGMAYLHKKGIIHRDLKPANVLLHGDVPSGNYQAKLADFGVAAMTHTREEDEELTSETGTYRWMAPEVIRHESYSFMADVYSYGVVTWQLLTHEEPFANKQSQIEAAGMVALEHARPPFPHDTPRTVSRLIEICWSENPYDRIPFDVVRKELLELHKNMSGRELSWVETAFGHPVYEAPPPDAARSTRDAGNPANIDVVKAMEKKAGGKGLVRSKSWGDDIDKGRGGGGGGGGDKKHDDGKWKFSLLRKSKK